MSLHFKSTRGSGPFTFEEALLSGLAPDGGLFVPEAIPRVEFSDVLSAESFSELGFRALSFWIGDEVGEDTLRAIVESALDFPVPLVALEGPGWEDVHVLELFHGPTLSFKDFGARTMAGLMGHFLERRGERRTILVATSGDTGSAVADGFAGQSRIEVVLLYPRGKVSPMQEKQLIVDRPGVRVFAVDGDFDDCQRIVKEAFTDPRLAGRGLSSANSINVGRLLPQMLYYAWAVAQLGGRGPVFCVPSGNLGNLTAGILAHLSGLVAQYFIAAHNANDFFPRLLMGDDEASFQSTIPTLSNAMDVGAPSNFERLDHLLDRESMRRLIRGASVTDAETLASIRRVYEETGYVADPHTAVGLEAVRRMRRGEAAPVVVLATAHPAKFPETVEEAIGITPEAPARLARLWDEPTSFSVIGPRTDELAARV